MNITDCKEDWRPMLGFEGIYSVSSVGRVRRDKGGKGAKVGRILSTFLSCKGYPKVSLHRKGKVIQIKVHKLVTRAFLGEREKLMTVNHLNGIKSDNRIENLEYCTNYENIRHGIATGLLDTKGEANGRSKLRNEDVLNIRNFYLSGGCTQKDLAREFNVSKTVIRRVVNKESWKHI